jgi:hypothetical protein
MGPKLPEVTPVGKPGNDGVVVATPTLTPGKNGDAKQQWMCDIVVGDINPLNVS